MLFKNKIRLVGLDLDGTLLKNDKTISARTEESLKNAAGRGILLVPVTGRPLSGVPECVGHIGAEYVITTNGARITEMKSGKCIYSAPIGHEKTASLLSALSAQKIACEAFADGAGYVEKEVMQAYMAKYGGTPVGEYIRSSRKVVESVRGLFAEQKKCADEIFISCVSSEQREELAERFAGDGDLQVCRLEDAFLEITARSTDKGTAFEFLCKRLGIKKENTAAFGDNSNDFAFFSAAGLSVAMGNASEFVKSMADITADTNENDGVAKLLDSF